MRKKTDSLLFRFAIIFAIFTLLTLSLSGFITFTQQSHIYKEQKEESVQQVAHYLESLIESDGEDFGYYKNYMISHSREVKIPLDFTAADAAASKNRYESLFAKTYPAQTLGGEVSFDTMPQELKDAFAVAKHEQYLSMFEKARDDFGMVYCYFIVPTGKDLGVYYLIDGFREPREDDGFINLCVEADEPLAEHERMWEAWNTGKRPDGYDIYDNEYGKTYAYYSPLIINGVKQGVVGVEVEVANVNHEILVNSMRQMGYICALLVLCVLTLLFHLYSRYISKLEHLQKNIRDYASGKNAAIASDIEKEAVGKDEISVLALQVSSMIMELEDYMKNLLKTAQELRDTQQKADTMSELATKDALTGIRNKTAYDNEMQKITWKMQDADFEFAIAMIDLNYLKKINDTFGHDKGNIAIKKLCYIVCHVFEHSPVYRVGGDEFVVVLTGGDFERRDTLYTIFTSKLASLARQDDLEPWERVQASIGIAVYDRNIDESIDNVFKRADKAMYAHKKAMKAARE